MFLFLGLLCACFIFVSAADAELSAQNFNILHRLYHPLHAPDGPFLLRGSVRLDPIHSSLSPQFSSTPERLQTLFTTYDVTKDKASWLYQVALERSTELDVSSVKACHLTSSTTDRLILHLSPRTNAPHAIDYFVSSIPSDGSCPINASGERNVTQTTVELKSAGVPPLPILKEAPKLTAEGQVVQPLPEKSFMQKYWMYIAGVMIALALTGGEEPPKK